MDGSKWRPLNIRVFPGTTGANATTRATEQFATEQFYLPSYAPELNPDERLNADMKHAIGAKVPVRTKSKLKAAVEDHMTMIGTSPERVRAYFQDPRVKYAA